MVLRHLRLRSRVNPGWTIRGVALISVVFFLLAQSILVHAAESAGGHLPEEVQLDGLTLVRVDLRLGEKTVSRRDYYVGGLYLESGSSHADEERI